MHRLGCRPGVDRSAFRYAIGQLGTGSSSVWGAGGNLVEIRLLAVSAALGAATFAVLEGVQSVVREDHSFAAPMSVYAVGPTASSRPSRSSLSGWVPSLWRRACDNRWRRRSGLWGERCWPPGRLGSCSRPRSLSTRCPRSMALPRSSPSSPSWRRCSSSPAHVAASLGGARSLPRRRGWPEAPSPRSSWPF